MYNGVHFKSWFESFEDFLKEEHLTAAKMDVFAFDVYA